LVSDIPLFYLRIYDILLFVYTDSVILFWIW